MDVTEEGEDTDASGWLERDDENLSETDSVRCSISFRSSSAGRRVYGCRQAFYLDSCFAVLRIVFSVFDYKGNDERISRDVSLAPLCLAGMFVGAVFSYYVCFYQRVQNDFVGLFCMMGMLCFFQWWSHKQFLILPSVLEKMYPHLREEAPEAFRTDFCRVAEVGFIIDVK